jgi:hypothetical protein
VEFKDADGNDLNLDYTTEFIPVVGGADGEYTLVVTVKNNSKVINALKGNGYIAATATVTAGTASDSDTSLIKWPATIVPPDDIPPVQVRYSIHLTGEELVFATKTNPVLEVVYDVEYLPEVGYSYPHLPYNLIYTDTSGELVDDAEAGILAPTWTEVGAGLYQLKVRFDSATLRAYIDKNAFLYIDVAAYASIPDGSTIQASGQTVVMRPLF